MSIKTFTSTTTNETQEIAVLFAKEILDTKQAAEAVVLGLEGDLGAGKTTFLQGFAKGLGIEEIVNSPTFLVMKRFEIKHNIFENFYHIDCYRLENAEDILALGFAEIIKNPKNIVAIEWSEKISKLLPEHTINITFSHKNDTMRNIVASFKKLF